MRSKYVLLKHSLSCFVVTIFIVSSTHSFAQSLAIDHVVAVVSNMDSAIYEYTEKGFTIKKGQLHQNGLLNAHIKFKNGSYFELMTVKGVPADKMAKAYSALLAQGEGGVFLALSGINIAAIEDRLAKAEMPFETTKGQSWDYLTFPKKSILAHFFFIEYHAKEIETNANFYHSNKSAKIKAVWLEGDDKVIEMLLAIGLLSSGKISDLKLGEGERFFTPTGEIIIKPKESTNERPRIKSISFGNYDNTETVKISF